MFIKIRRVKNEISAEDAKELLRNNKRGALPVRDSDRLLRTHIGEESTRKINEMLPGSRRVLWARE